MKKKYLTGRLFAIILVLSLCVQSFCFECYKPTTIFAQSKVKKLVVKCNKKILYIGGPISKKSTKLKVVVKPKKASKKVTYKSSNKKVITVSRNGKVTAKRVGKATITVTSQKNKKLKSKIKFIVKKYKKNKNTGVGVKPLPTSTKEPDQLSYTVSFNSNGGSQVSSVKVKAGQTISEPCTPTKSGYVFVGWYTSPDFDEMFLFNGDKVNNNITLYADWVYNDPDNVLVNYALSQLSIGYQEGDNVNNITKDITLPKYIEDINGVSLSWESSLPSIISSDGKVNRPDENDRTVELKVTATKGKTSETKTFNVNVIHNNNRNPFDIKDSSIVDIQNMNENKNVAISYNSDNTQVTSIIGKYSDVIVENADDALDAIQSVHTILGVDDPYSELKIVSINSNEYGTSYSFDQMYDEYTVYGRSVTVTVDKNGITDSLNSGFCSTSQITKTQLSPSISAKEAEDIVCNKYGTKCVVASQQEKIIYSLSEYEESPILTYMIDVTGNDILGEHINECVLVDVNTGDIVFSFATILDASSKIGSGKTEKDEKVSFPIAFTWTDLLFFYMHDLDRNIQMYSKKGLIKTRIGSEFNCWTDKTAISAYTNMIKVYDWYKTVLKRDSVDGHGMKINITVHDSDMKDNAYWYEDSMYFCDNSSGSGNTTASGLDIAGHEYTHGVVQYVAGDLHYAYNYLGAINEGYADVFGCLIEGKNWTIGEDWRTLRDATNPELYNAPSKLNGKHYVDPYDTSNSTSYIAHTDSSLLYHAAYLMSKDGISNDDLAKLWYISLSMGYDATSDFYTVRNNILKAGKKMAFSDSQMSIIRKAFDAEEIYDELGNIKINFVDLEGNDINLNENIAIKLKKEEKDVPKSEYDISKRVGNTLVIGNSNTDDDQSRLPDNLYYGNYSLDIVVPGYVPIKAIITVNSGQVTELSIPLAKEGQGRIGGTVTSATTGKAVENVDIKIYSGWNQSDGEILFKGVTDSNGKYSIELESGYYTMVMEKKDYATGFLNLVVSSEKDIMTKNASISPIMKLGNDFRVVLTWGENPSDLDSHLFGTLSDKTQYHIYYKDQNAYDVENRLVANLDVDDTTSYGPETTTFTAFTGGDYEYYIDWYDGSGTWATSNGKVEIYNGGELIYVLNVPQVDSQLGSWKVFSFKNGIFKVYNEIQEDIY